MHFQCTHHVSALHYPKDWALWKENTDAEEGIKHGSLLVFRLLWLKGIMGINVFLSNFQLLLKLHFVSPKQLAAAKEGGHQCSSAGKMGRDGDIQSSARSPLILSSGVTALYNHLLSGLHEQGSHFYVAWLTSGFQRKQAVGECIIQTWNLG